VAEHARWQQLQRNVDTLWNRAWDRHLRLAVTGLARSGKTAFVTSLVEQLESAGFEARLPHWQVLQRGRFLGAQQVLQTNAHIPSFAYKQAQASLRHDPPVWPEPTKTLSEIRIELRFRSQHFLRQKLGNDVCRLYLDIVDYPGEWLLDLPLLDLNYQSWSELIRSQLIQPERRKIAGPWLQHVFGWQSEDNAEARVDDVIHAAELYTAYLHQCRSVLGLQSIQPGRFVLPGEFAGAPLLQFVPWMGDFPAHTTSKNSLFHLMESRYESYKEHVVRQFYREHFSGFDRQIVLVDCLHGLMAGEAALLDLQDTLNRILKSFQYGQNGWWRRLFSPRIDKLLFVATKADHVTPEQHPSLLKLLKELVQGGIANARFEGIELENMVMAAIKSSEYHQVNYEGRSLTVLHGSDLQDHEIALFPGQIPDHIPDPSFWQNKSLQIPVLRPPVTQGVHTHIRLDQALEFLLGDKMA